MRHCLLLIVLTLGSVAAAAETADSLRTRAKAVLAQLEGEIRVAGLKEPVEVLRDRHGVAHLYAKNADDLFFAQGFVTAQDRLFQMDWWRRVAIGETAAVLGKRGLEGDRFARLVRYRGNMDAEWASYGPDARAAAIAFTHGINAYIDHLGNRLPIEFHILNYRPAKWQPEDCLGRMAGIVMARNFSSEVDRAALVAAVGAEKARLLAPTDPQRDYGPVPGFDLVGIDRSILTGYRTASAAPRFHASDGDGSNNWVVDGSLSTSGKPMLASDPHRRLALPSLRYLVHLNAPGWNVIGSGEPALPGVAIGHNERIAWGFTIVGTDQSDVYVEDTHPDDPTRYRAGDGWQKMTVIREKVAVKGEKEAEIKLHFTRHGPVIHQDPKRHRAYALRWVGLEPGTAGYLGSLAVDRAGNWKEFFSAVERWKLPSENIVYADVDGNIGWIAAALTPVRKGWDGLLPVPGAAGKYEWQGFLATKDLPQVFNPSSHFVLTANHNILPAGYVKEIGWEWAPPYRHDRLRDRLTAQKRFTLEDFQAMQHDETSLPGRQLARLASKLELAAGTPEELARKAVAEWDGVLSRQSRAGAVASLWMQELLTEFFRPHVPSVQLLGYIRGGYGTAVMLAALEKPEKFWFGDDPVPARDALLRRTLTATLGKLEKMLPGDPAERRWGRLHTAALAHPLANLDPAFAEVFNPPAVERGGDGTTPNNAGFDERFQQIHGASYREVFDLADWDRGTTTSTPGQSGQPGSPHYADLQPLWAEGKYFLLPFSRKKVEEMTQHRLVLRPAGE